MATKKQKNHNALDASVNDFVSRCLETEDLITFLDTAAPEHHFILFQPAAAELKSETVIDSTVIHPCLQ